MAKSFATLQESHRTFLEKQHVFFVATAPSGAAGHVNLSPKGLDSLRVIGPTEIVYLDFVGSGAETIAHLRQNGRIVLMVCAFDGDPRIVRVHGNGFVVEPGDDDFARLRGKFGAARGVRNMIRIRVTRVSDSCGYGVPRMDFVEDRERLEQWASKSDEVALRDYQRQKNARSVDGLPALRWASQDG